MSITPAASQPSAKFALSVDVEDYFQVWAFSDIVSRESWDGFPLRVGDNTRRCLDLFDQHNAKATFFTLGWIAERDPGLIRMIVDRGHELASHGYDHTKVSQQTPPEFFADVCKTKSLLEDIAGVSVKGYRAAGFSISHSTPWAYEMLSKAGHCYSSSSHPIKHDHYGDAKSSQSPYHPIEGDSFVEAPVATVNLLGKRVSAAGGGWFRASPTSISKALISKASKSLNGPAIFYFHPWEIDPNQPRLRRASPKSKLRHYLNLGKMESKLANALSSFPWRRIDDSLGLEKTT
ncbi:XrtA system polysaccharide deacetylase [Hyphococcus sp.]|uniref:XrtA system polysaccharide deacetylase n=1 Tax=Hyphococcus sp. TaxID=2038636 RepID=UPI002080B4C2|nr:MAG: polysaccharide deacetylase [Marinicaulis sp.]